MKIQLWPNFMTKSRLYVDMDIRRSVCGPDHAKFKASAGKIIWLIDRVVSQQKIKKEEN